MTNHGELPASPQVGDRVRLREDRIAKYREACALAGYPFDAAAVVTVTRKDRRPGGDAVWFDRAPWSYYAADCELVWNGGKQCPERRKALKDAEQARR